MTPNCVVRNEASRFGDGIATTEPKHCWRRLPAGTAEVKNRAVVARVVLVRFGSAAVYPRLPPRQVLSYPAPTGVGEPDGMRSGFRVDRVDPHGCGGASACPGPKREMPGRSPRVWGSLHKALRYRVSEGSIPTGVGEPSWAFPP